MKGLIIITLLTLIICFATALEDDLDEMKYNLRHRDLGTKVMCVNLGGKKGRHNIKVDNKKYWKKLSNESNVYKGKCKEPTKKLKNNLKQHSHDYCKTWNGKRVNIRAPEGLRKWVLDISGVAKGPCPPPFTFVELKE